MFHKYFAEILIALCYILIYCDQQVSAQMCQQDFASAFLNTGMSYQQYFQSENANPNCGTSRPCPTICADPALPTSCCNNYACFCTDSGFTCNSPSSPVDSFTTYINDICNGYTFYYGEYIDPNYQFPGGSGSAMFTKRDNNWPQQGGRFYGDGVVQVSGRSKYYTFSHQITQDPSNLFGRAAEKRCYARMGYAFLDNTVIGGNGLPNFGSGQAPSIGTCTTPTCGLDCSLIFGASLSCLDGTCICTFNGALGQEANNEVFMTTSTSTCQKNGPEYFYYGEIITPEHTQDDIKLFFPILIQQEGKNIFAAVGIIEMEQNTGPARKDFFFIHEYPM